MSTMYDYVSGGFGLSNLEYLVWLNGQRHEKLPRAMQRRIGETQLVVNIIATLEPQRK